MGSNSIHEEQIKNNSITAEKINPNIFSFTPATGYSSSNQTYKLIVDFTVGSS
jgi:hypothetical protein